MTILEMLQQSGILTILGMAVVFTFLTIMVFVIDLIGKIINRNSLDTKLSLDNVKSHFEENLPVNNNTVRPEIVAAISAAVSEYRGI